LTNASRDAGFFAFHLHRAATLLASIASYLRIPLLVLAISEHSVWVGIFVLHLKLRIGNIALKRWVANAALEICSEMGIFATDEHYSADDFDWVVFT
jgi:hypothetical protein